MQRAFQVSRSINGRQEFNTLNVWDDWELVAIDAPDAEAEPKVWLDDGTEEDDDWELVSISAANEDASDSGEE